MNARSLCVLALLFSGLAACQQEQPATAIAIRVVHQFGDELDSIQYRAFPADADPRGSSSVEPTEETARRSEGELDKLYVLTKGQEDELLVVVTGRDANAQILAESLQRVAFRAKKTVGIVVTLANVCRGNLCPGSELRTCLPVEREGQLVGSCEPVPTVTASVVNAAGDIDWDSSVPAQGSSDEGGRPDARVVELDARVDGGGRGDAGLDGTIFVDDARGPECFVTGDGGACSVTAQCGCKADGSEQCALVSGRAACVPTGSAGLHESCVPPSNCASGLACVDGICRKYCEGDKCTGPCQPIDPAAPDIKACIESCDATASPLCEGGIRCIARSSGPALCIVPKKPCEAVGNGVCNEPIRGDGTCELGTDSQDCCDRPFGDCELSKDSCGCTGPGIVCQLTSLNLEMPTAACRNLRNPPSQRGERCSEAGECAAGMGCIDRICSEFCKTDADCTGGRGKCVGSIGAAGRELKFCRYECDFDAASNSRGCASDTECARVYGGTYCFVQRQGPECMLAPATRNCDEGTRICAMGSDPNCTTMTRPTR